MLVKDVSNFVILSKEEVVTLIVNEIKKLNSIETDKV